MLPFPSSAANFRPLSCCNVFCKCIFELLYGLLKGVLLTLIDSSQSAFVPDRELLYNVLLYQAIVTGYNRKNTTAGCVVKVALNMAYDSAWGNFV